MFKNIEKRVRQKFEKTINYDGQIFGFEYDKKEVNRAIRFKEQNPNAKPLYPLIEKRLNKAACMSILKKENIELPVMYKLGYSNNNCVGCVKGGMGYWNKIKKDFPKTFDRMAKVERKIKRTCIKGLYLDELKPERGRHKLPPMLECDLFCEIEFTNIISKETIKIMNQKN